MGTGLTKAKIMTGRSTRQAGHARPQPLAYVSSREELQSLNDELTARNSQLQETVEQQRAAACDLQNILNSTGVATLFLDADLRIRFFTPAVKSLFNVIASDVGRPLADFARRFEDDDLLPDARAVLATQAPVRREVRADDGGWFMRAMLPYRSDARGIEGVAITFADISEMKAAEREIEAARTYLDSIVATIRQPLVVLDKELRVISASGSFHRVFSIEPADVIGRCLPAAGAHLDVPALRDFLAAIQAEGATINDHEVELDLPGLGRRALLMSARVLRGAVGRSGRSWWRRQRHPGQARGQGAGVRQVGGRTGQHGKVTLSRCRQS